MMSFSRLPVRVLARTYLLFIGLVTLAFGMLNVRIHSEFAMGDWLINYSGGFVRRGLFGQLLVLLSYLHLPVLYGVFASQIALYAVVGALLWRLAARFPWRLSSLAFWLSPATLAFIILNPPGGFRKEILLFALLAGVLLLLRAGAALPFISILLAVGIAVMILCHEGLAVFLPYLFAPFFLVAPNLRQALSLSLVPAVVAVAVFLLVFTHPGTVAQRQTICQTVTTITHAKTDDLCSGAIGAIGISVDEEHQMVIRTVHRFHYPVLYGITAMLTLIPLIITLRELASGSSAARAAARTVVLTMLLSVCLSLPLFYSAIDWGRWIYIHLFCVLLLVFFAFAPCTEEEIPRPTLLGDLLPGGSRGALAGVALLAYTLLWTLPFYGGFAPRFGYLGLTRYLLAHRTPHKA